MTIKRIMLPLGHTLTQVSRPSFVILGLANGSRVCLALANGSSLGLTIQAKPMQCTYHNQLLPTKQTHMVTQSPYANYCQLDYALITLHIIKYGRFKQLIDN